MITVQWSRALRWCRLSSWPICCVVSVVPVSELQHYSLVFCFPLGDLTLSELYGFLSRLDFPCVECIKFTLFWPTQNYAYLLLCYCWLLESKTCNIRVGCNGIVFKVLWQLVAWFKIEIDGIHVHACVCTRRWYSSRVRTHTHTHTHTHTYMAYWSHKPVSFYVRKGSRFKGSKYTFHITVHCRQKYFRDDIPLCTTNAISLPVSTAMLLYFNKNTVVPTERMTEFTVTQRYSSFTLKLLHNWNEFN